jgi:hypothetical protein
MEHLVIAATICLSIFGLVAALDGLYYHLWKYRLHTRAESRYEHKLHTLRAFLFIPIVLLLFAGNFGGHLLWLAIFFLLIDHSVEIIDVLSEKDSRASIGGLSSREYAAHALAITLRSFATVLILAAKPASAWQLSSPLVLAQAYPQWVSLSAINMTVVNIVVGGIHLWLMQKRYLLAVRAANA